MAEYIDRRDIFPNGVFYVNVEFPEKSLDELINRICNIPVADVVEKTALVNYLRRAARAAKEKKKIYPIGSVPFYQYQSAQWCLQCIIKNIKRGEIERSRNDL